MVQNRFQLIIKSSVLNSVNNHPFFNLEGYSNKLSYNGFHLMLSFVYKNFNCYNQNEIFNYALQVLVEIEESSLGLFRNKLFNSITHLCSKFLERRSI